VEFPFAERHQPVIPLLGGLDRLPELRRTVLPSAFGMAKTAEAPDRFGHAGCRATVVDHYETR
jgi:hypothetical protein